MPRRRKYASRYRRAPKARNKAEKCATKWCRNRRAHKTTRHTKADGSVAVYSSYLPLCWKCKSRRLVEKHPVTYVLNMLRHSARKRGIPFTITKEQFTKFCQETGYLEMRGKKPDSLTIDRIDPNDGYHIHNIRVLPHAENSAQGVNNVSREERMMYEGPEPDYVEPSDPQQPF